MKSEANRAGEGYSPRLSSTPNGRRNHNLIIKPQVAKNFSVSFATEDLIG